MLLKISNKNCKKNKIKNVSPQPQFQFYNLVSSNLCLNRRFIDAKNIIQYTNLPITFITKKESYNTVYNAQITVKSPEKFILKKNCTVSCFHTQTFSRINRKNIGENI